MSDWKTSIEHPVTGPTSGSDPNDCNTLEESVPFSPRRRPWYPQLIVVDDHATESGEVVRLRKDTFTLGRVGCDLSFPAEGLMSGVHAQVSLQEISTNRWDWVLEDLSSRNGVFIRLTEFQLMPGIEFLIGGTKVIVHGDSQQNRKSLAPNLYYTAYESDGGPCRNRFELEISPYLFSQESSTLPLHAKRMQLGRNADGASSFAIDPFVEPHHASIQKTDPHTWHIEDLKSLNGMWLRIRRVVLTHSTSFILGEQRFRFIIPAHNLE